MEAALEAESLDKRDDAPKLKSKSTRVSTTSSAIALTAAVTSTFDSVYEYCPRPGQTKADSWIYLATQNICCRCKVSGHALYTFPNAPQCSGGKFKRPPHLTSTPGLASGPSTSSSGVPGSSSAAAAPITMKTDSVYFLAQTHPRFLSTLLKGILDSGSTTTLMKRAVHEDNASLRLQRPISGTRLIKAAKPLSLPSFMTRPLPLICCWEQIFSKKPKQSWLGPRWGSEPS